MSIEHNPFVELRSATCPRHVQGTSGKNFAAYRDLDEQPIQSVSINETVFDPLVNALKVILSDSNKGKRWVSCSPRLEAELDFQAQM